jgi:hypothetical protein
MSGEWQLYVAGEAGAVLPEAVGRPKPWSVRPSLPLASEHNLVALREVLQRANLDDVVLFAQDKPLGAATAAESQADACTPLRLLDPGATPIQLLLHDGSSLIATCSPLAHTANAAAVAPLSSALYRFAQVGSALELTGASSRRLVRVAADGWRCGVAVGNAPLGSLNGCRSVSFRVSLTHLKARAPAAAAGKAQGGSPSDGVDAAVDADGLRMLPEVGDLLPVVAVGLCDGNADVEAEETTLFGTSSKAWLLHTVTGALHAGNRQTFVDSHQYCLAPAITVTVTVDTARGSVFFIQNGRHIGGFSVSKYLADSLYPCVELYTRGATVELL